MYHATIEPKAVQVALNTAEWKAAKCEEYQALIKNNTWIFVELPQNRASIGCKWVFKLKYNPDGSILKHKVRLVTKGFHQQQGFDYEETFSLVVKPTIIRVVLGVTLTKGWHIHQLDFNNVFLSGDLHKEVYMSQPLGFEHSNKKLVCKLNKALYGLKQAPKSWFEKLAHTLQFFWVSFC